MSDPWDEFKDEIFSALKESAQDFAGELKASANDFLRDIAAKIAQEKWRELKSDDPAEKEIARSNIRHLQGQAGAEIARLQLAATARAGELLERVLTTTISIVSRVSPSLFEKLRI